MSCYQLLAKYKGFRALKLQLSFPLFNIAVMHFYAKYILDPPNQFVTREPHGEPKNISYNR